MDFHLDEPAWGSLERHRPGTPFTVRVGGTVLRFRPPTDITAGLLLRVAADWRLFLGYCVVNTADLPDTSFSWWKAEHILRLYRSHHGLCRTPDDDARLFGMLEQHEYRDAAEADLAEVYHQDLGELWRSRRWLTLLNYLDRLRRHTHFSEVAAGDERLAKLVLAAESKDGPAAASRRISEFTVEAELLSVVADRLADILRVQVVGKGGSSAPAKPMPRPKTALAVLRERRDQEHVEFTLDRVFGRVDERGRPTGKGVTAPAP